MKNKQLFNKTIGILVNAYMNNTLDYLDCKACAVGNLVSHNLGYKLRKDGNYIVCNNYDYIGDWADAIRLGEGVVDNRYVNEEYVQKEIKATGYTPYNLAKIEFAFLTGCNKSGKYNKSNEHNFNGLMAVCDTLMEIHECSTEEINQAKLLFVK